jgi:hypothetical protein
MKYKYDAEVTNDSKNMSTGRGEGIRGPVAILQVSSLHGLFRYSLEPDKLVP